MYQRVDVSGLPGLFLPISKRPGRGVYFVRITQDSPAVREAVWRYHEAAMARGVIIENAIGNPDERQMAFLTETMGTAFETTEAFLLQAVEKWMPRMSGENRAHFAATLVEILQDLRLRGKSESTLKTVYCKLMCWLYYRFERLMPMLGEDDPPRILYEDGGSFTRDELILLRMLSAMGADVLLLEPKGEQPYLKHDPDSTWSQLLKTEGKPFPPDFTLKQFRKEMNARDMAARQPLKTQARPAPQPQRPGAQPSGSAAQPPRPAPARPSAPPAAQPLRGPMGLPLRIDLDSRFPKPGRTGCLNAWMKEADYNQILTPVANRGDDPALFYHALIRQTGVPDRLTFENELHQFNLKLKETGRPVTVVDGPLPEPAPEELEKIRRHGNYRSPEELTVDLAGNLPACADTELQQLIRYAFAQVMRGEAKRETSLNRLTNSAVYLLCWIRRYQSSLFQGYRSGDVPIFILMGGCIGKHDALLVDLLALLPVDVLLLAPDLNRPCSYRSPELLELKSADSLPMTAFPQAGRSVQIRTVASHAEGDLDTLLYNGSGMYRDRQFSRSDAIILQTTCDELFLLWKQELRYRPSFSTEGGSVQMPVLFASVLGVEKSEKEQYWWRIKQLLDKDTFLMDRVPFLQPGSCNGLQSLAVRALRDGRLRRQELKDHREYPYGMLREELQEHILDKLQLMLDRKLIRGIGVNGTEYTVISVVLSLKKELVHLLQSFDFTRKNPKVVYISTVEQSPSLEDAILLTFLHLVGFDVVLFVPTGYQTIERYLNEDLLVDHQYGDYLYDMTVPDFRTVQQPRRSFLDFFRR